MKKRGRPPKEVEMTTEEKKTAQELLSDFIKENNIILDYEVQKSRVVDMGDGLVVVPSNAPVVKIKARYGE